MARHTSRDAACAVVVLGVLALPAAATAHDSSATPTALEYGVAQEAKTTEYGVDRGEQNAGPVRFTETCGLGHAFGASRTAWYAIRGTGGQATVRTAGSNYDTTLFAYAGSPAGMLVVCNDDGPPDLTSSVTFPTAAGVTYVIQAGSPCDGATPPCPGKGGLLHIAADNTVPGPPPPADSADFGMAPKRVRPSRSGRFTYRFAATPGRPGSAKMQSTRRVTIGSRRRPVKVPRRGFTPALDGRVKVNFRLTSVGVRALSRRKSLRFAVTVVVGATPFTTTLVIRRPKRG